MTEVETLSKHFLDQAEGCPWKALLLACAYICATQIGQSHGFFRAGRKSDLPIKPPPKVVL